MACSNTKPIDIEDIGKIIELRQIAYHKKFEIRKEDKEKYIRFVRELCNCKDPINKCMRLLSKKYKIFPSKAKIRKICMEHEIQIPDHFREYLIKKKMRSMSGIVSIGVSTKPIHSCSYRCSYCPTPLDANNQLYVPKSYDETEGAIARGLRNCWKGHYQVYERGNTLMSIGHMMDKLELIVRGGTFHCYSEKYQIQFITELYYGANTFYDQYEKHELRSIRSLKEEISINKRSKCRVIGLTLETRPDFAIKNFSCLHDSNQIGSPIFVRKRLIRIIRNLRKFGCTRIEFGIQHTDNDVLEHVKRDGTIEDAIFAIRIMKNCCFKIVGHWMPDLPGSSVERDYKMMEVVMKSPDLQLDDWKIYPTATTPNTEIYQWFLNGDYIPYSEQHLDKLIDLCIWTKTHVPKWIRIDRLTRDIPSNTIEAGYHGKTNLRQIIHKKMRENGQTCRCIRCKEPRENIKKKKYAKLAVIQYCGSGGDEYFISYDSCNCRCCWRYYLFMLYSYLLLLFGILLFWKGCKNRIITYGFCRLRLSKEVRTDVFPELRGSALVRELKVYGRVIPHFKGHGLDKKKTVQHSGMGRRLMRTAERIAIKNRYKKISVVHGVGTEEYYVNKLGYYRNGNFVTKNLR